MFHRLGCHFNFGRYFTLKPNYETDTCPVTIFSEKLYSCPTSITPLLKSKSSQPFWSKFQFQSGNRPDTTCVPSPCRFSCCSAALPPPRCNLFGHSLALAVLNTHVESFARSSCSRRNRRRRASIKTRQNGSARKQRPLHPLLF